MSRKYKVSTKSEISLVEAARKFIAVKEAQHIAESTMTDYKYHLIKFLNASNKSTEYKQLEDDTLQYFSSLPDSSPAAYNKPFQNLNCFFNWMEEENIIEKNPIKTNKLKKKHDDGNIRPISIEDIRIFLKSIDRKSYAGLRDYTIVYLMLDCGIRTSEINRLTEDDFNYKDKELFVKKENAKTKTGRMLYLKDITASLINDLIKEKESDWKPFIFCTYEGNQLRTPVIDKTFQKYSKESGIKITPYQLRHTFATEYAKLSGGDVFTLQKQMGHSNILMTKRYTDVNNIQIERQHNLFSPITELQTKRKTKI